MSLVNEILAFCPNNTGTNLESQAAYAADSNRTNGNQPGTASSMLNNKAIRQATYIASQMGEFLKTVNNQSVLDNATPAQLLQQMLAGLQRLPPQITSITATGAGTYNLPYAFFCATATAAINDTYSDGTTTFTVIATLTAGTLLYATGATAPITGGAAGTLTKSGGAVGSSATITYYAVRTPIELEVEMVGAGGGGGAALTNDGTDGGNTTFGTTLLVANGGSKGLAASTSDAAGGSASLGTGPLGIAQTGASGSKGFVASTSIAGGYGGNGPWGGGGAGGRQSGGGDAITNSGSGGGGGGHTAQTSGGAGGGAGGYVKATITTVLSTYAYSNGAKGAKGAAGNEPGGDGADGRIVIWAKYQ